MIRRPEFVLLRLRIRQCLHACQSLPFYYLIFLLPIALVVFYALFQLASKQWEIWVLLLVSPLLFYLLRKDHFTVLRQVEKPSLAIFFESLPLGLFAAFAGWNHHPFGFFLPLLVIAGCGMLPPPYKSTAQGLFHAVPAWLTPWLTRESRALWHKQAPWLLLLMLLTLPALLVPVLSLWVTALLTLLWSGPILQSESWLELRASGRSGLAFFFGQYFYHFRPLMVWSLLVSIVHALIQPEVAWLSLVLPVLQGLYGMLMWSLRYAYWRPSSLSAGQMAASVAAIGLIIPVIALVIPLMLAYYLPRALSRLQHELLPNA